MPRALWWSKGGGGFLWARYPCTHVQIPGALHKWFYGRIHGKTHGTPPLSLSRSLARSLALCSPPPTESSADTLGDVVMREPVHVFWVQDS